MEREDGKEATCTATIVGSHALITAQHCTAVITADIKVSVGNYPITVDEIIPLKYDQAFILESGVEFPAMYIAPMDLNNIHQEDVLKGYGNPKELTRMYRQGVVMGFDTKDGVPCAIIDMHVAPGDSGMGLFKDGKLVAVVSGVLGWDETPSLIPVYVERIDATPEQIKKVTTYAGRK
jgi:hypothetical protein